MGIDAQLFSAVLPKARFLRAKGPEALTLLETSARQWAADYGLGPLCQTVRPSPREAEIRLLPIADPVHITVTASGIGVAFRSSNCGPGFHAAVIDMLDHLAQKHALVWTVRGTDGSDLDETGYATLRDFTRLQDRMASFARELAGIVDSANLTARAFCLPAGLGLDDRVCGPCGPLPENWVAQVLAADTAALRDIAAGFFPWWGRARDGAFWAAILRAQLWQNAQWRADALDSDRLTRAQIAFSHAALLRAAGAAVPADLDAGYRAYMATNDSDNTARPSPDGMGYRRGLVHTTLYKSWAMRVPGYASFVNNDGGAAFEHPAFWLGTQSYMMTMDADKPPAWLPGFDGPDRTTASGLIWRQSAVQHVAEGGRFVQALVLTQTGTERQILLLTLSSHLDWPYAEFAGWVDTVTSPQAVSS